MASKTYYNRVPHSTFICSKGTVVVFTGGKAFVEDARIQAEIEAAIKAGGHLIMTEEQFKKEQQKPVPAAPVPVAPAPNTAV